MSDAIRRTTETGFDNDVLKADRPVLVDFYADWCGPCRMVAPILSELATDYGDRLDVIKVDVDDAPRLASQYGIRSIPTLMLFKGGEPVETVLGVAPKARLDALFAPHVA